jgi:hypothetical protein
MPTAAAAALRVYVPYAERFKIASSSRRLDDFASCFSPEESAVRPPPTAQHCPRIPLGIARNVTVQKMECSGSMVPPPLSISARSIRF